MAKEIKFKREYYLHMFTQNHLKELFDLELVASEIQRKRLRFDNLAFDENTCSFVIIEYKNRYDGKVLKQVREYQNLIKNDENRKYFLKRLNKKIDVDFDHTRIMIIGPKFDDPQIKAASKNGFEIWKVTLFDDCTVEYENPNTSEIKKIHINENDLKIAEEKLLENRTPKMKKLYKKLTKTVLEEFNDVDVEFIVNKALLKVNDRLVCEVEFLKYSFNIYFHADRLNNAYRTIDVSNKSTGGKAKYKLKYASDDDLNYFLNLFKQAYNQKRR